ncbi:MULTISPECIES: SAM-dependent chlorinase/fluorinase [unclassified Streptomyces]|uniref:SAM-dependent chlorinase/fluorinase n=1 Tax=unclassified Streptomyces TaxID=2593676 RepID=UPI003802B0CA
MASRIVIVSDCSDVAFVEMRLVIQKAAEAIDPGVDVRIEPLVIAQPFSEINAAFLVRLVAESAAEGTVIMCVLNSAPVRSERLVGRTERGGLIFVGANTGALGWLAADFGVAECFQMADPGFVPFGGKAVHAPVVGALAAGRRPAEVGEPFSVDAVRRLPLSQGLVVHVDNFGNAKFAFDPAGVQEGDHVTVSCCDHTFEAVYGERMMDHQEGVWVVYPGSSFGLHELGQVRSRGMLDLDCGVGCVLDVHH